MWETLYEVILHFISFSSQFEVWSQLNGNKLKLKTEVHCFCNRQSSIFNITTHHMIVCCYSKWHTRKKTQNVSVLLSPTCSHIGVTQSSTGTLNVSSCTFRLFPLFLFRAQFPTPAGSHGVFLPFLFKQFYLACPCKGQNGESKVCISTKQGANNKS